nr:hypothetical protein 8 [Desulfobacterales bacterium]
MNIKNDQDKPLDDLVAVDCEEDTNSTPLTREEQFIRNLCLYDSTRDAAIAAGYSKSYANGPLYQRLKNPDFQNKIREYYIQHSRLVLPKILKLNNKIIEYLVDRDNFKETPKYKDTLRQILQVSGLLQTDKAEPTQTINYIEIRKLMTNLHEGTRKGDEPSDGESS